MARISERPLDLYVITAPSHSPDTHSLAHFANGQSQWESVSQALPPSAGTAPEGKDIWVFGPWLRGGESMLCGTTFKCGQAGRNGRVHVLKQVLLRAGARGHVGTARRALG